MSHKLRTAEDACVEYALAASAVREAQLELAKHICHKAYGTQTFPARDKDEECLTDFFSSEIESEQMCAGCQKRLEALDARRAARSRFGAAKRSVEAVGKRLNKESA